MVGGNIVWNHKKCDDQRHRHMGFTLIEVILVITIMSVLIATAWPLFLDLSEETKMAVEIGEVAAIRSGITLYGEESRVLARAPIFPSSLDNAASGISSPSNSLFSDILTTGMTDGRWQKTSANSYTSPSGESYLYDNSTGTFESGNPYIATYSFESGLDDWDTFGPYVNIENGNLVLGTGDRVPENRAFTGDPGWTDYIIETNATLNNGSGYGIFFRTQNPDSPSGYTFQYDPGWNGGEFIMRRWDSGRERNPFASASPADPSFQWNGVERNIRVEVSGDTFRAFVDDELVLTGSDSTYGSGAIGVRSWNNGHAEFDGFTVSHP